MLVSFSMSKSFSGNPFVIQMKYSPEDSKGDLSKITQVILDGQDPLLLFKVKAIGETTSIVDMFRWLKRFIVSEGKEVFGGIPGTKPQEGNSCKFEFSFLSRGYLYKYGFILSHGPGRIIVNEEWLFVCGPSEKRIFIRYHGNKMKMNSFPSLYEDNRVGLNNLVLWELKNNLHIRNVLAWFKNSFRILPEQVPNELIQACLTKNKMYEWIREFLHFLDQGISDIQVDEKTGGLNIVREYPSIHDDENHRMEIPLYFEGSGIQKSVLLAVEFYHVFTKGGVLLVDNLSCHLHVHLRNRFISMFQHPYHNLMNAQLIFTDWDTSLFLSKELLYRKEL